MFTDLGGKLAKAAGEAGSGYACEADPDYLEHLRREAQGEQLDLPWEP